MLGRSPMVNNLRRHRRLMRADILIPTVRFARSRLSSQDQWIVNNVALTVRFAAKEDINTKLSDKIALVFARLQFFVNYPELGLTSISRRP